MDIKALRSYEKIKIKRNLDVFLDPQANCCIHFKNTSSSCHNLFAQQVENERVGGSQEFGYMLDECSCFV